MTPERIRELRAIYEKWKYCGLSGGQLSDLMPSFKELLDALEQVRTETMENCAEIAEELGDQLGGEGLARQIRGMKGE